MRATFSLIGFARLLNGSVEAMLKVSEIPSFACAVSESKLSLKCIRVLNCEITLVPSDDGLVKYILLEDEKD